MDDASMVVVGTEDARSTIPYLELPVPEFPREGTTYHNVYTPARSPREHSRNRAKPSEPYPAVSCTSRGVRDSRVRSKSPRYLALQKAELERQLSLGRGQARHLVEQAKAAHLNFERPGKETRRELLPNF